MGEVVGCYWGNHLWGWRWREVVVLYVRRQCVLYNTVYWVVWESRELAHFSCKTLVTRKMALTLINSMRLGLKRIRSVQVRCAFHVWCRSSKRPASVSFFFVLSLQIWSGCSFVTGELGLSLIQRWSHLHVTSGVGKHWMGANFVALTLKFCPWLFNFRAEIIRPTAAALFPIAVKSCLDNPGPVVVWWTWVTYPDFQSFSA